MFETGAAKAVQTSCLNHYRDPLQIARRSGHECLSAELMIGKPRFYVNISAAVPKRPPAPLLRRHPSSQEYFDPIVVSRRRFFARGS